MKAIVYERYGSADVLKLEEVDRPAVPDDGVLVRVRAASVNPADWHPMRGEPLIARLAFGLRKPKQRFLGLDLAGQVEAVGKNVMQLHVGDEVFGTGHGALAEYALARQKSLAAKPPALTFEQAAAVPVAAITALQGLRDHGNLQPRQKVLINGASGGVGTFAVQIAKSFGADVTGVCSTGNVEMVRSLGADRVIDYTQEDFTRGDERYDLILDIAGSRAWSELKRVLDVRGAVVLIGGPSTNRWLGPVSHLAKVRLAAIGSSHKAISFIAAVNHEDLVVLQGLLQAGKVTPVVDRTYPLSETADAIRYLEGGHARGKVVISV